MSTQIKYDRQAYAAHKSSEDHAESHCTHIYADGVNVGCIISYTSEGFVSYYQVILMPEHCTDSDGDTFYAANHGSARKALTAAKQYIRANIKGAS